MSFKVFLVVGVWGFEPQASWTRTKRDTKLRHTPIYSLFSIKALPQNVKGFLRREPLPQDKNNGPVYLPAGMWYVYENYANHK